MQRWALYLARFDYVIEHVQGEANVCADMLTRWIRGYRKNGTELFSKHLRVLKELPQIVPRPETIEWPSIDSLRDAQKRALPPSRSYATYSDDDGLWKVGTRLWIPCAASELQLKLLVLAHCGSLGHRGRAATKSVLLENFVWKSQEKDVQTFVDSCLHCMVSRSGERVLRPMGHALHGLHPNEVVQADFLSLPKGIDEKRYILLIRDDLSSYVWLWPVESHPAKSLRRRCRLG